MTIDEAITQEKELAEEKRRLSRKFEAVDNINMCLEHSEKHEQIAEWLEELKALKNGLNIKCDSLNYALEKGKKMGYNKAVDDFVRFANTMPTVEEEDGEIRPMWLEEMAEQLKKGER